MDKWLRFFLLAAALLLLLIPSIAFAQQCTSLDEAITAVNEARYDDALELLQPLAGQGNPDAQNVLGGLYLQGLGVSRDYAQARHWFEASAAQGNPLACYNLGGMYANGIGVTQDCAKALALVRRPAEEGQPIAQVNLGALYAEGSACTPQDFREALRWFREAAAAGDPLGQHSLGAMYANGQGVEQDYGAAMAWYRKAAEQGLAESQAILGWMYEFGEGVEPDLERAAEWYGLAADRGDARAQQRLQAIESGDEAGPHAKMFATYMAAPAQALAMEYNRVETVFMMIDIATSLHVGDIIIDDSNREEMRADFIAMQEAMLEAMRQRGAVDIGGRYAMSATKSCGRLPSMWAEGVAGGYLGDPEIRQDGHEFMILQDVLPDSDQSLETPGIIVEDVMVFSDMMNTDFVFTGHAAAGTIVIGPDADFILDGWPEWLAAPGRHDLESCLVTLTRH